MNYFSVGTTNSTKKFETLYDFYNSILTVRKAYSKLICKINIENRSITWLE